MIVRADGTRTNIVNRPNPTPNAATIPKSPFAGIGEVRFVKKLMMVVALVASRPPLPSSQPLSPT